VIRATLWGAGLGIVVTGAPLVVVLAAFPAESEAQDAEFAALAIATIAIASVLGAITCGASTAMNTRLPGPRAQQDSTQPPVSSQHSFDERLGQYLEEGPRPAVGADASRKPSMAFFLAFLPGPRYRPKSPSYIREILLRIHRLLRLGG
jgi:hypothetical protein